ncbi:protein kinase domain-containing protein [Cryptosporangium aurantiacum]|uniref:Serine/threonine protein kinase n=1 Tax=Cryptosporangium aurantiacum TaxID=134849 RepID=A0A1M7HFF1_9ACTN|nr:protein kinase [Cryptosporangium aurantiacum]SHM27158.1 serine/threonine protein kinase [Cryptosporangium aurantiacum]
MGRHDQMVLDIGEDVDGYSVESFVARGGMAVVYKARDRRLGRPVALKLIAPELASDPTFRARFTRESELAASLDHPNVLPIYQAGEIDGMLYTVMRFVDGEDLDAVLKRRRRLTPTETVTIFTAVAAALDAAHAHRLVHRDVKPGNILLTGSDDANGMNLAARHVYLTDFGLTKRSADVTGLTTAGQFLGTIAYVAPEQIANQPVDHRADVYSLGCVLYHVLSGAPPFARNDYVAMMWAHISTPPPTLTSAAPDLPAAADAVLLSAMAKRPGARPSSCGALVGQLRDAFGLSAEAPFRLAEQPPGRIAGVLDRYAGEPVDESPTVSRDSPPPATPTDPAPAAPIAAGPAAVGQVGAGPAAAGPAAAGPAAAGPPPGRPLNGWPAGPGRAPVFGPPVTGPPVTGPPVTGPPVTGPPVTGPPVTGSPVTGSPVTGEPMTGGLVTGEPATGGPVTGGPVAGEPVTGGPVTGGVASDPGVAPRSPAAAWGAGPTTRDGGPPPAGSDSAGTDRPGGIGGDGWGGESGDRSAEVPPSLGHALVLRPPPAELPPATPRTPPDRSGGDAPRRPRPAPERYTPPTLASHRRDPEPPVPRDRTRLRALLGGLLALALVVSGVVTWLVSRNDDPPGTSPGAAPSATGPASSPPPSNPASIGKPSIVGTVQVGNGPQGLVFAPDGRRVYVANSDARNVSVIDTEDRRVVATIATRDQPQYLAMSPKGDRLYVSTHNAEGGGNAVVVVDTAKRSVVTRIPIEDEGEDAHPYALAVSPDGVLLYVPDHDRNLVLVIDTTINQMVMRLAVQPAPHWVAFSPDGGNTAYLANHESNLLTVVDTRNTAITATIPVGKSPHSVAVTPDGTRAFTANYDVNTSSVVDLEKRRTVGTVPVGGNPRCVTISADGRHAYFAATSDDTITVVDTKTLKRTASVKVGADPYVIVVSPDGRTGWVTNRESDSVSVLSLTA